MTKKSILNKHPHPHAQMSKMWHPTHPYYIHIKMTEILSLLCLRALLHKARMQTIQQKYIRQMAIALLLCGLSLALYTHCGKGQAHIGTLLFDITTKKQTSSDSQKMN